jgi:FtsP/CotA-like multicopper oxidase with cupredoxin domain
MYRNILFQLVIVLSLFGFATSLTPIIKNINYVPKVISCGPGTYYSLDNLPRIKHPRLIYPDDKSDFPRAVVNDNTVPAGELKNNTLEINLEIEWSDFYLETDKRPGLRLVTIAEKGKAPTVPAPLIRIKAGTIIHAVLHNTLKDSTAIVYGLQKRPSSITDSLFLKPRETKEITFESGTAGTYMYGVKISAGDTFGEEQQLGGAFIIDPPGGSPPDRVMVMNIFSTPIDTSLFKNGYLESLTINGKSWPFTERISPSVGDTVRWRIINSSIRMHPMHLHGFYYTVLSKGSVSSDHIFEKGKQPEVVTDDMDGFTTMNMKWVAARPGNWLYHCHLSFHVTRDIRLPGTASLDPPDHFEHMAGLVIGINIKPGASDLISKGEPRNINLYAHKYIFGDSVRNGFSLFPDFKPDAKKLSSPGPLLVLKQYQPTYITVVNKMPITTSVHWHGLQIDSWADGVPDWSASAGKSSLAIDPGKKFTYKLSLMHPGTFIYHSHLDDINQLTSGLYGPLIVMGEHEVYNPKKDHFFLVAWKTPFATSIKDLELNGSFEQPNQYAHTGETHRLRLINIGPAASVKIMMLKNGKPVLIRFIAKDGMDLPAMQQSDVKESPFFGVGETADFQFKPLKAGIYNLRVSLGGNDYWNQQWVVTNR